MAFLIISVIVLFMVEVILFILGIFHALDKNWNRFFGDLCYMIIITLIIYRMINVLLKGY